MMPDWGQNTLLRYGHLKWQCAHRCNGMSQLSDQHDAGDLDKTIEYYEKHFGLKKTRYRDIPEAIPLQQYEAPLRTN